MGGEFVAGEGPLISLNELRLAALAEQYLIPLKPGWFKIQEPPPAPSRRLRIRRTGLPTPPGR